MRAHQIMTRSVISITPDATILEAANTMLRYHVSGLPVVDAAGKLVGIVSEGDFIRRSEIGTQRKRGRWLKFLLGAGAAATDYVHEHGRKVSEVMTSDPITVTEDATLEEIVNAMETNGVKRLPVMKGDRLVGIVSRANLLQAVAGLAREVPDPTADDDHIRSRIIAAIEKNDWSPFGLNVIVRDGIVHLSGVITEERSRQAAMVAAQNVAGVRKFTTICAGSTPCPGCIWNRPKTSRWQRPVRRVPALPARGATYPRVLSVNARMMSSRAMIPASCCSASSTGRLFIRWSTISCRTRVSFVAGST
jgi:CBS domain-containing protein